MDDHSVDKKEREKGVTMESPSREREEKEEGNTGWNKDRLPPITNYADDPSPPLPPLPPPSPPPLVIRFE